MNICISIFLTSALRLIALAVLFLGFAGYNFIRAYDESVWFPPDPGVPPAHNVASPINAGSLYQAKYGDFGARTLLANQVSVGGGNIDINNPYPTISFADPTAGSRLLYMQNHSNTFNFLGDRNGDGKVIWANDQPVALQAYLGTSPDQDFIQTSGNMRASQYCDKDGGNCFTAAMITNLFNSMGADGGTYIYRFADTGKNAAQAGCVQINAHTGDCTCPATYRPVVVQQTFRSGNCTGSQENCTSVHDTDTVSCIK